MRAAVIPGPALLNALPGPAAVLNRDGVVVSVNQAWRNFGRDNGGGSNSGVGRNYLQTCARAAAAGAPGAAEASAVVAAALDGRSSPGTVTYTCHGDRRQRWFELRAEPLRLPSGQHGALVLHLDVTASRQLNAGEGFTPNRRTDRPVGSPFPAPQPRGTSPEDVRPTLSVSSRGGHRLVSVAGRLEPESLPELRSAVLEAIGERPGAVVVDLSRVGGLPEAAGRMFSAVARQTSCWPAVRLCLAVPDPETRALLASNAPGDGITLTATLDDALRSAARQPPVRSESLSPADPRRAARDVRHFVTEVCQRWLGDTEVADAAALVASELATNAVVHTGSLSAVQVLRRDASVVVAVSDDDRQPPALLTDDSAAEHGRGMRLVDGLSRAWGVHERPGSGKVVWAAIACNAQKSAALRGADAATAGMQP